MLQPRRSDLEAQTPSKEKVAKFLRNNNTFKPNVQRRTKFEYLVPYFICNVSLMLYNKAVLGKFDYPWLLTTLHAFSATVGCGVLYIQGRIPWTKLSGRENLILLTFSFLFTINIAISNVSLSMVSMPFHQVLRSTCPLFTILICRFRYSKTYPTTTYLSLIPIVIGVALATYGDYYFTTSGFLLTLLGVILASIKTIASNHIMTGPLSLSPLEILFRMSPLAFVQSLTFSTLNGELASFVATCTPAHLPFLSFVKVPLLPRSMALTLAGNGALAFILNISSFSANKNTGALTMTVCGNVKQCLTITLGILIFGVKVTGLNGLGILITLAGAAWYSMVEFASKSQK